MKSFKVQVDNGRSEFFKELLKSLDFVTFEEVDGFNEPRVYPGGKFEIRSRGAGKEKGSNTNRSIEKGMEGIREVLSNIDQMRDKSRK